MQFPLNLPIGGNLGEEKTVEFMSDPNPTSPAPADANRTSEIRATEIRKSGETDAQSEPPRRRFEDLPPAAQRALMEAEERRRNAKPLDLPKEIDGRNGPEPVRYGDWEKKGIASDF